MFFTDHNKVLIGTPTTCAGTQTLSGTFVNMENFDHISIVWNLGVMGAASGVIQADADGSGTGTAIAFDYTVITSGATGAQADKATATTAGFAIAATDSNKLVVAELDASELPALKAYVKANTILDAAGLVSVTYILSRGRYAAKGSAA